MWAKRLAAAAVLGGIVAAAGCETCQSCRKKDDGVSGYGAVGSSVPAGQAHPGLYGQNAPVPAQMPAGMPGGTAPATTARPAGGAYGGTSPAVGPMQ
ncbi:MAG: hypothetical protein K2X82_06815 [Gemmataceae bacterium]|nr:hypothetical protein [Gemmataceae bacterium]